VRDLHERIAARIRREGSISFSAYVDLALYDADDGFYSAGGQAGRRGDFITSPEVGLLFGAVIGRALDTWWDELGRPDPFVVIEAAAGVGTLARTVLEADPRCLGALTYVLVEQSTAMRARHADHLPMTEPTLALAPAVADADGLDELTDESRGSGPRFVSLAELPALSVAGVVLANELLDNLAFDLVERTATGWADVRVGIEAEASVEPDAVADSDAALAFVEMLVPLADDDPRLPQLTAWGAGEDPDAPAPQPGARLPIQHQAGEWVSRALGCLDRGRLVVIDYGDTSASLARRPWHEWLRTYRGQDRGIHPLDAPGWQDITTEVAVDQLDLVRRPDRHTDQATFLREHGIDDLVAEGRRVWEERAHLGDLTALKARSRVTEAAALVDTAGLGGFRVLTWIVD
jgi:SAM-dependent MidA family methyltransferase